MWSALFRFVALAAALAFGPGDELRWGLLFGGGGCAGCGVLELWMASDGSKVFAPPAPARETLGFREAGGRWPVAGGVASSIPATD